MEVDYKQLTGEYQGLPRTNHWALPGAILCEPLVTVSPLGARHRAPPTGGLRDEVPGSIQLPPPPALSYNRANMRKRVY